MNVNSTPTAESGCDRASSWSPFSRYLPRLKRPFYQGDAIVFWTMPVAHRQQGWLTDRFHAVFCEMLLHAAAREGLLCPACCLMPDHIHLVWMGVRLASDQRNGIKFLRAQLGPYLRPVLLQHQAHDHVLCPEERAEQALSVACTDYVLLNALRAGLVENPQDWPYVGAVLPGYPRQNPFDLKYWPQFWKRYYAELEGGITRRVLPRREIE